MDDLSLSIAIENTLVARNPRNMQRAQQALQPGYVLRGSKHLYDAAGCIIIGTGFPVIGTFETDGPVGCIALYETLLRLGKAPMIACGPPLSDTLGKHFNVLELTAQRPDAARVEATEQLTRLQPAVVMAIERPGLALDERYYNMRGEDISDRCYCFDPFIQEATCPTIGIGDGGNEVGMGNIAALLADFDITPSVTRCDELVVSDVSNWGAYAMIALLDYWSEQDLLAQIKPLDILNFLSLHGSVDGVTGINTLTEDGMAIGEGLAVLQQLQHLVNTARH